MFPATLQTVALQSGGNAALALVYLLFSLGIFAAWVYASYWVYKDARRRGSRHALAWGVGVFLIGLIGLLLYLFVRDDIGGGRGPTRGY